MSAASREDTLTVDRPTTRDTTTRRRRPAPFISIVWALAVAEFAWAVAGVTVAMLGVFSLAWVLPVWAALAVVLWWLSATARRSAAPSASRLTAVVRALAVAVAVAAVVVNGALPGEHLQTGRDGGTYTATAGWLATDGDLLFEPDVPPFGQGDDLGYETAGFHAIEPGGPIYAQFMHAFPAMMATVDLAAGLEWMIRTNAVLGGLALLFVYAFAERLMRPWAALATQVALAVNLVFVYFTRAPFSELLTMGVIFAGLWALDQAIDLRDRRTGLLAGLLIGGAFLARLDGLVVLLMAMLALLPPVVAGRARRVAPAVLAGVAVTAAVALVDLFVFSPFYVELHVQFLVPLALGFAAVAVLAAVAVTPPARAVLRTVLRRRRALAWGLAAAIVVAGVLAYTVRPSFEVASWDRTTPIGGLQQAEGEPVDEARTYAEQSALWLGWYLGVPALAIALLGWAALVGRSVTRRDARLAPFLLIFSGLTVLYVWQPTITPDHIWADRRFLPVIIPGLLVCAAWLLDRAWSAGAGRRWGIALRVAAVAGAVAMVAGPLARTAPLADMHEREGFARQVAAACEALGDDAALLVLDEEGTAMHYRVTHPLRSHCGVPAAWVDVDVSDERIVELAERAAPDRTLYVLASTPASLDGRPVGDATTLLDVDGLVLEQTLTEPPSELTGYRLEVLAAPVTPAAPAQAG